MRLSGCVSALIVFGGVLIHAAVPVFGHAAYDSSTPAQGEVLAASPAQVSITFTQEVQKISGTYSIQVTDAAGTSITAGDAALNDEDRTRMSVSLEPALPPGRYVVRWTNVSDADGDPAAGAFSFYIGVEPTPADLAADAELAALDEDDAVGGSETAAAGTSTPAITPPLADATIGAAATATPPDDSDGGSDAALVVTVAVVAAAVVAAAGAAVWYWRRER